MNPIKMQSSEPSQRCPSHWLVISAVLAIVFFVSLWSIRAGQGLGDDFAMYILQARNFAEGQPNRPTGYLYNPAVPHTGPPTYPPVVPLILAGVYRFAGLDLEAMKIVLMAVFVASLIPLYMLMDEYMKNPLWSGLAVLSIALNPLIVSLHSSIGSDLALWLFIFTFLYASHLVYDRVDAPPRSPGLAFLCGVLAWAAFETRSVGAVLIFVAPTLDLIRFQRISRFSGYMVLTVCCCLALQSVLLKTAGMDAPILSLFVWNPVHAARSALSYLRETRSIIPIGWKPASMLLYALILALTGAGAKYWARRGAAPVWIFSAGYLLVILLYEVSPNRYVYPLLPVLVLLVAGGAIDARSRIPGASIPLSLVLTVYLLACAQGLFQMDRSPIREGIGDKDLRNVAQFIEANARADAVVVFRKPRLLALMTGRSVSVAPNKNVDAFLGSVNAQFVLLADNIPDEEISTQAPLRAAISRSENMFRPVLSSGPYHLFKCAIPR